MVFMFDSLDTMNQKNSNEYPVPAEDQRLLQSFVILNFVLYLMPPLFQAISFVAYALETGENIAGKNDVLVYEQ
jgi:hypothetical protein